MRFFSSAGEWDDENCTMALPFACVKSKGAFYFERKHGCSSFLVCLLLSCYFHFFFSGSEQSDRWVGLSDRDSLQVPLFHCHHCHHCHHKVIFIILLHISSEVFSLNLTPLLSVLEHFFVVPLPLATIPFPIISHQTFAWSDETPVTFTNWGTGMPRYDRDYDDGRRQ